MGLFSSSKSKTTVQTLESQQGLQDFYGQFSPVTHVASLGGNISVDNDIRYLESGLGGITALDSFVIGATGQSQQFFTGEKGYLSISAGEDGVVNIGGTVSTFDTNAVIEGIKENVGDLMTKIGGMYNQAKPYMLWGVAGAVAFGAYYLYVKKGKK